MQINIIFDCVARRCVCIQVDPEALRQAFAAEASLADLLVTLEWHLSAAHSGGMMDGSSCLSYNPTKPYPIFS